MLKWLENAVFYQIYPISYFDSDGDGMGDLRGIADKADYIKSLGVDAVWLNPFFKSPFKDGGYDISDYYEIDKRFGTMKDLDDLITVFKEKKIKIVLDLVIGHTSDKHVWFKKSAAARRNKYYDYYVWTDSVFTDYPGVIKGLYKRDGGYLPNYYASQPALNYGFNRADENNPWKIYYKDERLAPLREEILNIMRFYLDKGIDGFRVDMAGYVVKESKPFKADNPYDEYESGAEGAIWFWQTVLGTLRKEYKDKVYIAEWVVPQCSIAKSGFDMDFLTHDTIAFNELFRNEKNLNLDAYYERGYNYFSPDGKGSLDNFVKYAEYLYGKLGDKGMFTAPTTTHDEIRMPTGKSPSLIKCIFAFLLTIKQVPFIYYGDEIGLEHNYNVSKDGGGKRTGARTPMQWTEERGRGFSTKHTTYLPVSDTVGQSFEAQKNDEHSLLNTVKKLIRIRKKYSCFNVSADQWFIETGYPAVYERSDGESVATVMINPSDKTIIRRMKKGNVLISENCEISGGNIILKPQSYMIAIGKKV